MNDDGVVLVRPKGWLARSGTPGRIYRFLRLLSRKPLGLTGGILVLALVVMAIAAPWIAPHGPNVADYRQRLQGPSLSHLFGTDEFGHDLLSRIVYGARISMQVGLLGTFIGAGFGLLFGVISGYLGGRTDMVLQRVMDAVIAFPALVLAMTLVFALPNSLSVPGVNPAVFKILVAIGFTLIPYVNRVVRGAVFSVMEEPYVEAARAIGARPWRIMLRYLMPNVMAPLIVVATALVGFAILTEAALSYLGLGVPPDVASWGAMLSQNQQYFRQAIYLEIFPGLFITLAVLGVNLFGDALRDLLDPRLRGG